MALQERFFLKSERHHPLGTITGPSLIIDFIDRDIDWMDASRRCRLGRRLHLANHHHPRIIRGGNVERQWWHSKRRAADVIARIRLGLICAGRAKSITYCGERIVEDTRPEEDDVNRILNWFLNPIPSLLSIFPYRSPLSLNAHLPLITKCVAKLYRIIIIIQVWLGWSHVFCIE